MTRRWAAFAALLFPLASMAAAVVHDYPPAGASDSRLTIYGNTDIALFEPVLRDFQREYPGIAVRYEELDARPLYERHVREAAAGEARADVLLSTAMDLQVKLVNDGYAMTHVSENSRALPAWARWRDEAFGFTFEPAVMVFNRQAMQGHPLPQSRGQLLDLLRVRPKLWRGRVGTYDISRSSVGYLLASQDVRQSSEMGALVETFADVGVHVGENSAALLDRLESGELAIGYNLLGSYARSRIDAGAPLVIVYPQDHTLVVTRTVVLPKGAPNAQNAHRFLEYLLSLRGQEVLALRSGLPALRHEFNGRYDRLGIDDMHVGLLRPIALGPGLLVYLDAQKRSRLLSAWRAILAPPPH